MVAQQVLDGHDGQDSTPIGDGPHAEGPSNRPDPAARLFRHRSPANQYRHDNQPLPARRRQGHRCLRLMGLHPDPDLPDHPVDRAQRVRRGALPAQQRLLPLPVHPAQSAVFHSGRLRRPTDPAEPEPHRRTRPHQGRTRFRCQRTRVASAGPSPRRCPGHQR